MLLHNTPPAYQARLHNARRILGLFPIVVFLLMLMLFSGPVQHSSSEFLYILLECIAVSLASSFVSIAAYGFYRYLVDRSPGL